jgi:hypothetical protein
MPYDASSFARVDALGDLRPDAYSDMHEGTTRQRAATSRPVVRCRIAINARRPRVIVGSTHARNNPTRCRGDLARRRRLSVKPNGRRARRALCRARAPRDRVPLGAALSARIRSGRSPLSPRCRAGVRIHVRRRVHLGLGGGGARDARRHVATRRERQRFPTRQRQRVVAIR